jgi:trehalose/maltose transport system substrate-binding protein
VGTRFAVAPLPSGTNPHSSVLGGWYLAVSKHSRHREDAIALVRYVSEKEWQRDRAIQGGLLPTFPSLFQDSAVLRAGPLFAPMADVSNRLIRRPAALAGPRYDQVSRAYAHGVHLILTRKASAQKEAEEIDSELKQLTGFSDNPRVGLTAAGQERQ